MYGLLKDLLTIKNSLIKVVLLAKGLVSKRLQAFEANLGVLGSRHALVSLGQRSGLGVGACFRRFWIV